MTGRNLGVVMTEVVEIIYESLTNKSQALYCTEYKTN